MSRRCAGKLRFARQRSGGLDSTIVCSARIRRKLSTTFKAEIEALAKQLYGDAEVSFERDSDPRQRLNVRLKTSAAVELRQALDNLQRH